MAVCAAAAAASGAAAAASPQLQCMQGSVHVDTYNDAACATTPFPVEYNDGTCESEATWSLIWCCPTDGGDPTLYSYTGPGCSTVDHTNPYPKGKCTPFGNVWILVSCKTTAAEKPLPTVRAAPPASRARCLPGSVRVDTYNDAGCATPPLSPVVYAEGACVSAATWSQTWCCPADGGDPTQYSYTGAGCSALDHKKTYPKGQCTPYGSVWVRVSCNAPGQAKPLGQCFHYVV
eukprot:gene13698-21028_t